MTFFILLEYFKQAKIKNKNKQHLLNLTPDLNKEFSSKKKPKF